MPQTSQQPQGDQFDAFLAEAQQPAPAPASAGSPPPPASSPPSSPEDGATGAFARGVGDSLTFGLLDEAGGLADALNLGGRGGDTVWNSDKGFGEVLSSRIAGRRALASADEKAHPYARIAGQIGGGVFIPYGAGARGTLEVAKVGAVTGAAHGLGSGEGLEGRVVEGAKEGALGGVLGGLLGRFVPGLKAPKAAEEAASAVPPQAVEAGITPEQEGALSRFWNEARGREVTPEEVSAAYQDAGLSAPSAEDTSKWIGYTKQEGVSFGGKPAEEGGTGAAPPQGDAAGGESAILGETNTGALIVRPAAMAGEEIAPESVALTRLGEDGTELAVGSGPREALDDLQKYVDHMTTRQQSEGDRAVDVTWETTPEAAKITGEWRIGSLGSGEDAMSLLGALARGVTSRATRSDEELAQSAKAIGDDIGEDPEALLSLGREIAGKLGDADTSMMALRTVWAKASENVTANHLMNINWATASDELVEEATSSIYNLSQLSHLVQTAKTGLGRGLRVNRLPTAEEYLARVRRAREGQPDDLAPGTANLPATREQIADWFQLWGMTGGNPKAQAAMMQGALTVPKAGKYLRSSFANFFTASILSAPRTIALNVIGPGAISVIRNVERITGAGAMALNPLATAAERASARNVARMTGKAYVQTFMEIGDAFKQGLLAAEQNHTIIGGGSSGVDALASYGPLTDNLLRAAGAPPSPAYTLGNLMNVWPRAFARVNNGLDEAAKRLAYQGEVRVNAMVDAADRGLTGRAFQDHVSKAMTDAYDAVGRATDESLLRSAERTTLTSRVGEDGTYTRTAATLIQKARSAVPELRYILPIFNVPANALGETMRRLPIARVPGLNKLMFAETVKELAGDLGPVAQADAHGRTLLGAAFLTAGYMMNQQGTLTGAGPQEPTDRKVWLTTHQPYSIRLGGEWVRYDKFDILGGLLSIPATMADSTIYSPEDRDPSEIMFAGVGALAQWFKDRAAIRQATSLLALGDDPTKSTERTFTSTAGAIAAGFYPAALRTLVTDGMTNPYVPMRRSWSDYIESALPFNSVEPIRNILGEPIQKSINTVTEALVPVSTVKAIGFEEDPILDELDRLYTNTGYGAGADTTSFSYGQFADKDLKLEDGYSLYGRAMQKRQTLQLDGMTLRESLAALFALP